MEVNQQHVSYEAHNKPERGFQHSLELWRHEERIPLNAQLRQALVRRVQPAFSCDTRWA
jgi:hypothetical protein